MVFYITKLTVSILRTAVAQTWWLDGWYCERMMCGCQGNNTTFCSRVSTFHVQKHRLVWAMFWCHWFRNILTARLFAVSTRSFRLSPYTRKQKENGTKCKVLEIIKGKAHVRNQSTSKASVRKILENDKNVHHILRIDNTKECNTEPL